MSTDRHSASRMIGMQELAQLQAPLIPKNTYYCILPSTAVILTLDHVSPPVSPFFVSHHSRCDTASSLFASKCLGECYAGMAALCDLWDPGWGDPRFPH